MACIGATGQRIEAQRAAIERAKANPPRTIDAQQAVSKQVDPINGQVKGFNQDVAAAKLQSSDGPDGATALMG